MPDNLPNKNQYVTVSDAAKILNVSIDTIRRWNNQGLVTSTRLDGKNRYFLKEELKVFKQSRPLSISEAARSLSVSISTLKRLEQKGLIVTTRDTNGERLYSPKMIEEYLAGGKKTNKTSGYEFIAPVQQPVEVPSIPVENNQVIPDEKPEPTEQEVEIEPEPEAVFLPAKSAWKFPSFGQYRNGALTFASIVLITSGVFSFTVLRDNPSNTGVKASKSQVLAATTKTRQFTVNIQSLFNDNIKVNNKDLTLGTGNLTASNIIYGITAGNGIVITPGQNPVISATATGVSSFGNATGAITLGSGLTVTNNTLNATLPSTINSFATVIVDGTSLAAGSGSDTLTFTPGSGVSLSASGKTITVDSTSTASDWTLLGTDLYPDSTSNNVGIGNTTPAATLDVTGTLKVSGTTTLNNIAYTWPTTQSNSFILETNASGVLTWLDPGTLPSSNYFSISNGTIYPNNPNLDLLIGGDSTASAKFGLVGVSSGAPAIQINGVNVLTGTTLGSGIINSSLISVGALSSGSIVTGFGTIITGNITAGTTLNGTTGINTGAGAGTQRIDSSGNLTNISNISSTYLNASGNTVNLSSGTSLQLNSTTVVDASRNLKNIGTTQFNTVAYTWPASDAPSANYVLVSDSVGGLSWVNPGTLPSTNFFNIASGEIHPTNTSLDFLVGGTSSAGAKFGFLGVSSGVPVIQISGNTVLTGTTLGSLVVNSSLTSTGALSSGSIASGFGNISTSNTVTGTTLNGTTGINTAATQRIDSSGNLVNIGTTQLNGIAYTWPNADGGPQFALTTNGLGGLSWAPSGSLGTNYFSIASGAIYPNNPTLDFLIGDSTSASAKFGFLNVSDVNPAIQINGVDVLAGTYLGGGVVNSSLTSTGALVSGLIVNGFGTISTANTITGTTLNGTTGINTGAVAGTNRIDSAGNLLNIGTTQLHGVTYTWPVVGGSNRDALITSGGGSGGLSWASAGGLGTNYFSITSGAIYPTNTSLDFLIGDVASATAKFGFINVDGGAPSIQIGGNTVLTSDTLGLGVLNSSLTSTGILTTGSIASGFGTITTANTITGATLSGTLGINTGAGAGTQRIDSSNNLKNIGTTQFNTVAYTWPSADGGAGDALVTNGGETLSWSSSGGLGTNYFAISNGTIYPYNTNLDFLIGNPASASAKFGLINTSVGVPSIQIGGNTILTGDTLGLGVLNSSLTSVGALTGGSIGGAFGNILTSNTITGTTLNGTLGINTGAGAGINRIDSSGNLVNIGTTQFNTPTYTWPGSQSSNYVMQTDGSGALSWVSPSGTGFGVNYFTIDNAGTIYPTNVSLDFLVGGTTTASARFGILNVNSGSTTASLSAGAAGGAYLTAAGNLQTTAMQKLVLGGSTTGDIQFLPGNTTGMYLASNGYVGIGTTTPGVVLDVSGAMRASGNFYVNGGTSNVTSLNDVVNTNKNLGANATATGMWSTGAAGGTARDSYSSVYYNGKIYYWGGSTAFTAGPTLNTIDIYDISSNSWSTGNAGGTLRMGQTSVLYNGKIYSWGGRNNGGTLINTMDIYDIAGNSWSTGNAGGTARWYHNSVVYNGRVYSWGGCSVSNCTSRLNTMDIYDIAGNSWSTGNAGGTARWYHTSFIYNGKMYSWGGSSDSGNTYLNTVDIYDIANNSWSTGTAGGTARYRHTSAFYNNRMYAFAGYKSSGMTNTVDIYNPASDSWTTGTTGGTIRDMFAPSAPVYNGKVYIWGGCADCAAHYNTMDIYDITKEPWSTGAAGGSVRRGPASVLYNGKIYSWGGYDANTAINTVNIYDIAGGTWSTGTAGGTARYYHTSVLYNGKIYSWGGTINGAGSGAINTVDIYDIAGNSWSTGAAGGTARFGHTSVLYNGKIYSWGGQQNSGGTTLNTLDIYDIAGNSWSTGAAGGIARQNHTSILYNGKIYSWGGYYSGTANTMDIYDIAGNSWSTGAAGGTARQYHTSVLYNGKIYSWGGQNGGSYNTVDIYDIASNSWSTGVAGGTARAYHTSILYNGKIYSWGGCSSTCAAYLNTVDIYDVGFRQNVLAIQENGTDTFDFQTGSTLFLANGRMGIMGGNVGIGTATPGATLDVAGTVRTNNNLYVNGGTTNMTNSGDILNVNKNLGANVAGSFSNSRSVGTERGRATGALYNGKVYSWGGCYSTCPNTISNSLSVYDIASDSWSTGASGGTSRQSHTSVLYNGKMYMWGGNTASPTWYNTMDIYDIANNSWSTGAAGGTARAQHTSVIYNGKMYSWGGQNNGAYYNTVDIYDIAGNTWSTGAAGGTARWGHTSVLYNGKIYSWGGYNASSVLVNTMDIYDIANNSWSTGAAGGTARYSHASVLYNGKIYSLEGSPGATVDIYDIANNSWSNGGSGGGARQYPTSVLYNGKIYSLGGDNTNPTVNVNIYDIGFKQNILALQENGTDTFDFQTGSTLFLNSGRMGIMGGNLGIGTATPGTTLDINGTIRTNNNLYVNGGTTNITNSGDIINVNKNLGANATGSWSAGAAGGTARNNHVSVLYNGKIYSWAGTGGSNTVDIYDIASNSWSKGLAGGTARTDLSAVLYNGKIYFWGGYAGGYLNTLDIYDITNNSWSTGAAGGTARQQHTSILYNGKIYSWGGNNGSGTINTIDIYDITNNSWSTGAAGGTARNKHTSVLYNGKIYSWGGRDSGSNYLNTVNIYDIAGNSWSTGAAGGTARYYHTSVLYNGRIYSWGGFSGSNLNTMNIYDIASNSWSTGTAGGTARLGHTSVLYNGKIYSWGGFSGSNLNTMDIYDIGFKQNILSLQENGTDTFEFQTGSTLMLNSGRMGIMGGNVGINTASPSALLDVNGTASISGQLKLYGTPTIQSTANQNLTLGGDTTGDVVLSPRSGTGTVKFNGTTTLNGVAYTWPASSGSAGYALTTNGAGTLAWASGSAFGSNYFTIDAGGTIYPTNVSLDFLIGNPASASATFGLVNINSGNPAIQIGGNTVLSGTTLGTGVINSSLTSVSALTGGSIASGFGSIATSNTITGTTLNGTTGINTGAIGGTQRIDSAGNLVSIGTLSSTYLTTTTNVVNLAASTVLKSNNVTVIDASANLLNIGTTQFGPIFYTWPGSQSANYVLQTDGAGVLSWVDPMGAGFGTNYFTIAGGAMYPTNTSTDFLIGGNSTASAQFAILNVASGTPVASLSAGAAGGMFLTANGTLQTTANQDLVLGGNTTGDIQFLPGNSSSLYLVQNGYSGIGNGASPSGILATLDVNGAVRTDNNFYNSGGTSNLTGLNDILNINKNLGADVTDSWSTGAASPTVRYMHSSVLYNGKIYSTGGYDASSSLNTVSIYDIAGNSWSDGAAGGEARYQHTSVLYNGKIYSWGGSSVSNTLDIYDINGNSWSTGASGGTVRYGHTATVYNGKMYIWGGWTSVITNTVDIYDIANNTWTTGAAGGTARMYHTSVLYGGKIYSWGGYDGASTYYNTVDIYDIAGNTWSTGVAGGTTRWQHSSVLYNGKIYSWAGKDNGGSPLNTVDVYDIASSTWSTGTAGGTARRQHTSILYNGKVYSYGGYGGSELNSVDIYDIGFKQNILSLQENGQDTLDFQTNSTLFLASGRMGIMGGNLGIGTATPSATLDVNGTIRTNSNFYSNGGTANLTGMNDILNINKNLGANVTDSWSTGQAGGTARYYHTSVLYNGNIYSWGGYNGSNLNTLDIYNIATDSWSTGASGGTARQFHTSVLYNGKIYSWGGLSGSNLNTIDIYDIAGNSWSTGTTGGTTRYGQSSILYNGKMYSWGGYNGGYLNTMDIYTIGGSWTTGAAGGTARMGATSVLYSGKIYLWGGSSGSAINTMDIYDIAGNSWTTGAAGGTARSAHTSILYNGKIYSWGGSDTGSTRYNTVDIYDIANNSWSTGTAGGTNRYGHTAVIYNGKVYSWGGRTSTYINTMDIYDIGFKQNILSLQENGQDTLQFQTNSTLFLNSGRMSFMGGNVGIGVASPSATLDVNGAIRASGNFYVNGGTSNLTSLNDVININKNLGANVTDSWSTGQAGGTARYYYASILYNGKIYSWGGWNGSSLNTVNIYDIAGSSWSTGTAGGTPRYRHTSIFYNGKIYSWGGRNSSGTALNTVDIYDIAGNSWSTGAAGGTARYAHTSVLYNGKIYSWGGWNGGTSYNTVDIYDIAGNSWSTGAAGGTARKYHTSILYNGKIYSWGGDILLNTVDIYDIASNSWSTGTAGGTPRYYHTSILYNGKIYSWGGTANGTTGLNTVDIYDIAGSSWSTGTAGGTPRYSHTSILYNGKIYSWGGMDSGSNYLNTVDIYDIGFKQNILSLQENGQDTLQFQTNSTLFLANGRMGIMGGNVGIGTATPGTTLDISGTMRTNNNFYVNGGTSNITSLNDVANVNKSLGANVTGSWSTGNPGGTARYKSSSVLYNGKIYFWGGSTTAVSSGAINTMDIYDIASNTWSTGTAGGTARWCQTSVVYNGKIYSWGGINSSGTTLNTVDIYDIVGNVWSTGNAGGTARYLHTSILYNGKIYSWGGMGPINTMNIYDIAGNSWTTGTTGGTARYAPTSVLYNGKIYLWGGTPGGSTYYNTVDIYDISSDSWSTGTAGGTGRSYPTSILYNGKIYFWGGWNGSYLNTVDIYDIAGNSWSTGAAGGTARYGHTSVLYNGKIYSWGGYTGGGASSIVDIYDIGFKQNILSLQENGQDTLNFQTGSQMFLANGRMGIMGGNVGIGSASAAFKLDISTSVPSDRGINVLNTAATGTNYGIYSSVTGAATQNTGGYFMATGATTNYGLQVSAMSGATSTGLDIGALSGATANTGVNVGGITGTGTGTSFAGGNISSGSTTKYGLTLGTMTGATASNYQINTGILTSATTTTNAQLNLGGIVTSGGTTNYGINVGALSGSGTTNYGVNLTASSAVGTTNYGINIGNITGAASGNNYGLYIGTVSGANSNTAANNFALYSASSAYSYFGGNVGIGVTNPGALLSVGTGSATNFGVNSSGDITSAFTVVAGSSTANGTGTNSTSLIVQAGAGSSFTVGNYVQVSSTSCSVGVNVCYAKITNIATDTLTISPALSWANSSAVAQYHIPEIGGVDTSQALANRYGRGYFIDGIVAGNGSSYFTDRSITFAGGSKILDSAGKLALQAGGVTAGSGNNGSIYFNDSTGTTRARIDTVTTTGGNSYATLYTGAADTSNADVAELYHTNDANIEAGDLVVWGIDVNGKYGLQKTNSLYDTNILGVISTAPGVTLGSEDGADNADQRPVALSGRVPLKVSTENGAIHLGDSLTSSSIPGVAMRATKVGKVVGIALEDYDGQGVSKIEVFMNLGSSLGQVASGMDLGNIYAADGTINLAYQGQILTADQTDKMITEKLAQPQSSVILGSSNSAQVAIKSASNSASWAMTLPTDAGTNGDILITDGNGATSWVSIASLTTPLRNEVFTQINTIFETLAKIQDQDIAGINDKLSAFTVAGDTVAFARNVVFNAATTFNNSIQILQDMVLSGPIQHNDPDTAGFAIIKNGNRDVKITFDRPYEAPPVISIASQDSSSTSSAYVKDVSSDGFTVSVSATTSADLKFSWNAILVQDPRTIQSVAGD